MPDNPLYSQPCCAGIVLAGGLGTRMGGPGKPFVMLAGRSMLDRVVCRLLPQVDQLLISANTDPARFRTHAVPVIADRLPHHHGPLAGILAGMHWTAEHRPDVHFIASAAADTPFFPRNLVHAFLGSCDGKKDVIVLAASARGVHPVFGLWPVALADDLEMFLRSGANPRIRAFAGRHIHRTVLFDDVPLPGGKPVDPFFNINTPQDIASAEAIAHAMDVLEKRA